MWKNSQKYKNIKLFTIWNFPKLKTRADFDGIIYFKPSLQKCKNSGLNLNMCCIYACTPIVGLMLGIDRYLIYFTSELRDKFRIKGWSLILGGPRGPTEIPQIRENQQKFWELVVVVSSKIHEIDQVLESKNLFFASTLHFHLVLTLIRVLQKHNTIETFFATQQNWTFNIKYFLFLNDFQITLLVPACIRFTWKFNQREKSMGLFFSEYMVHKSG